MENEHVGGQVNWTIKLPELDEFVTFHSASSSSKMSSTVGRRRHHYTSEKWKSNWRG